jgi:hypothetical protein
MNLLNLEQAELARKLQDKGFTKFEVDNAVEHWTSQLPSSFKFKTSFPAADAHCKSSFGARVFKHTDSSRPARLRTRKGSTRASTTSRTIWIASGRASTPRSSVSPNSVRRSPRC